MIENADSQLAPRCLVRRWRDLESWITTGDLAVWDSPFDKKALGDVVSQRRERLQLSEAFGESKPITIHLTGDVSIRDRDCTISRPRFCSLSWRYRPVQNRRQKRRDRSRSKPHQQSRRNLRIPGFCSTSWRRKCRLHQVCSKNG